MILYILFTLLSIISPFVGGGVVLTLLEKHCPSEKHRYANPILTGIFTLLTLGLPGWIMAVGGYFWFSTSCWLFLRGLLFYGFALLANAGNRVESFVTAAIISVLAVHLGSAVATVKEARDEQTSRLMQFSRSVKRFQVRADQTNVFPDGSPRCFTTKMVGAEGKKVGFMYREKPGTADDSGWRFLEGDESKEYLDESDNLISQGLKTFARRNPEVAPFLDAPVGSAFAKLGFSSSLSAIYVNQEK